MPSRHQLDFSIADSASSRSISWIHVVAPGMTAEITDALRQVAVNPEHPTLEEEENHAFLHNYGDFIHMVLYSFEGPNDGGTKTGALPLHLAVTDRGVVTWSRVPLTFLEDLREKLKNFPQRVSSVSLLLYFIIDELLGSFFPFLDRLNERISQLERSVLIKRVNSSFQRQILELKRLVMQARRILASMRDVIHHLVGHVELPEGQTIYYFELYDHVLRLFDTVDTYRELLASVLDVYLSTVSNRLNEIVKTLTLVTTLMLPASLVTSLYGMNMESIPGARHPYGFFLVLSFVIIISGSLLILFKRRQWL